MSKEKLKVLVISGRVLGEHYYPLDNERIRRLLESTGRFEVKVTEEFNGCNEKALEGYDLIFMNYDGAATKLRNPEDYTRPYVRLAPETEQVILKYVENGGGIYWHHSSLTWADDMPEEFFEMWGITRARRRWEPFATNGYPGGDNGYDFKFTGENEFTRGLPSHFWVVREDLYTGYKIDPAANVKVLATAFAPVEPWIEHWSEMTPERIRNFGGGESVVEKPEDLPGINQENPLVWTNTYGKGRVFVCTPGNDYETWNRTPYLTLVARGAEWAATGEVTLDPPDLSGMKKFRPWPYYDNTVWDCKSFKGVISNYL